MKLRPVRMELNPRMNAPSSAETTEVSEWAELDGV